jgi:putative transposase
MRWNTFSRRQRLNLSGDGYIFFLPPYCSEMNPIETQWRQLKAHEIAGQMFDNEYDLAMTVIEGMESRSQVGDYTLERFRFNCA